MTSAPIALVAFTVGGAVLARRLKVTLGHAEIHGFAPRIAEADRTFAEASAHLQALFAAGTPVVAVCSAGIVIRALAPLLVDKRREGPVVVVAEDGSVAIPLLGGHHGANALARQIAMALGGAAAITTAGELALGLALDEPPPGWRLANPDAAKRVAAALLSGEAAELVVEAGEATWLADARLRLKSGASWRLLVTDRAVEPDALSLVYHPPVLALGVGAERGVAAEEVIALVERTLADAGLAAAAIACVASHVMKEDEAALDTLAGYLGVPARFFTAETLAAEEPRLSERSELVRKITGAPAVAEAAALAAAGEEASLVVTKRKSDRATCAIARSPRPIDPARVGRARGRLYVVGIGPGDAGSRTGEADEALAAAEDIVGYSLYLDLLGPAIAGKRRHASPIGAEEERARMALTLAAEGRAVALVSSGDAGIYGLAALVVELIAGGSDPGLARVDLRFVPGISALQAAAARAGAPLGHDFCVVSLSDLLTPWPDIERRLLAAADGDFVVALYNPASRRRDWQLPRALEILGRRRGPDTPVIVARNLGRPGEQVEVRRFADAGGAAVDMLSLVLVGSTATQVVQRAGGPLVFTPRGYSARTAARDGTRDP